MHYSTAEVMIQATCCCCQSEKNLSAELISGIINTDFIVKTLAIIPKISYTILIIGII